MVSSYYTTFVVHTVSERVSNFPTNQGANNSSTSTGYQDEPVGYAPTLKLQLEANNGLLFRGDTVTGRAQRDENIYRVLRAITDSDNYDDNKKGDEPYEIEAELDYGLIEVATEIVNVMARPDHCGANSNNRLYFARLVFLMCCHDDCHLGTLLYQNPLNHLFFTLIIAREDYVDAYGPCHNAFDGPLGFLAESIDALLSALGGLWNGRTRDVVQLQLAQRDKWDFDVDFDLGAVERLEAEAGETA